MTRRLYVAACAMIALSTRARAQDSLVIAGADRETMTQLSQIVATTSSRGLPTDPVISEAMLGAVHRVSGPRIVTAARDVASRLEQARDALAPQPSDADIAAGAEALKYKIPLKTLRTIRAARAGKPVAVHLGLMIQLVNAGVSVARAEERVLALIQRNATSQMLADLGNAVNADVARGGNPDKSLDLQFQYLTARIGGAPGGSVTTDLALPAAATPGRPKKP